jgi:hypothetical protein
VQGVQGYLAHTEEQPRRSLQQVDTQGYPMVPRPLTASHDGAVQLENVNLRMSTSGYQLKDDAVRRRGGQSTLTDLYRGTSLIIKRPVP